MTSRYLVPLLCFTSLFGQIGVNAPKVIDTYCSGCHNGRMRSPSGVLLDQFDAAGFDATKISASPNVWSRAYRQLQAGTMPPVGSPRPDRATYDAVLASIEQALGANAKAPAAATNQEIATRLATLLWNSAPDAALLQDAQRNGLSDPATLERQIHRMLADDRAQTFVARFFFAWLELDKLSKSEPDKKYFPDYDVSLRDSLVKETELFLLSQLRDDRDPIELWSANYTFLNQQLAKNYDIPNVSGAEFRRVLLSKPDGPNPERAGLLGQGSILMFNFDAALFIARYTRQVDSYALPGSGPAESVSQCPAGEARVADHPPNARSARRSLRYLPSQLLSAGLCAGELRSAGPLAHSRPSGPGRRFGRVRGWHVNQRSCRTPPGPVAAPRRISNHYHRKTAGLLVRRIGCSL